MIRMMNVYISKILRSCGITITYAYVQLTVVNCVASETELCVTDNNDATTTHKDFTGTNVVQSWPVSNLLVIKTHGTESRGQ